MVHKRHLNEFAIVSLALGILSFVQLAGIEKGIAAVVFGILALKKIAAPNSEARGEGMAAFGIVLGIIYSIIAALILYVFAKNPELKAQILEQL